MSRDPFDGFFGNRGSDRHNNNNNNNNNGNGPSHDPFDDPFFREFTSMSRQMDKFFDEFFNHAIPGIPGGSHGDDPNGPTIIINRHPDFPSIGHSSQSNRNNQDNRPHLSQINPNINPSQDSPQSPDPNVIENDNNSYQSNNPFVPSRPRPLEYQGPSLSDINPDINNGDNNPIISDKNKDSNLIHPNGPPPGFRSPYLPNWNGAEESIEKSQQNGGENVKQFFRSSSVVISTGPDGKTTKRTMIRDENGNVEESTETFDNMDDATGGMIGSIFGRGGENGRGFGFGGFDFPRMLGWGIPNDRDINGIGPNGNGSMPSRDDIIKGDGNNSNNSSNINNDNPWVMRPSDPFGRFRPMIDGWKQKWKGKLFGYRNDNGTSYGNNEDSWFKWNSNNNNRNNSGTNDNNNEWFWGYRNNNNNNNNNNNGTGVNGFDGNNNEVKPTKIEWKDSRNYRRPGRGDASKLRDEIIKPNNDQE